VKRRLFLKTCPGGADILARDPAAASFNGRRKQTKIPQFLIFGGIDKPGCTTTGIVIHQ
jgi:hypothetical protein